MKTDSQFYDAEGSVRLNLLEAGRATLQRIWITKHSPSRHRFTKWSRKWSCGYVLQALSQFLYNNYRYLTVICGAQKRASNFIYFGLITVTYFGSKI
jgi:hypothetical protein